MKIQDSHKYNKLKIKYIVVGNCEPESRKKHR